MRDSLNAVGTRDYYNLESEWKTLMQEGKNVNVEISISYPGDSVRPNQYTVYTYVDGQLDGIRDFRN